MKNYLLVLILMGYTNILVATDQSLLTKALMVSQKITFNSFDEAGDYISKNGSYNHPCNELWIELTEKKNRFEAKIFREMHYNKLSPAQKIELEKKRVEYLASIAAELKNCIMGQNTNQV